MATRKKSKLSFNAKMFIAIIIILAAIMILSGTPETAQFFKSGPGAKIILPTTPKAAPAPTPTPAPAKLAPAYVPPSGTVEISFKDVPGLESVSAKVSALPATPSQPLAEAKEITSCQEITAPGLYILKNNISGVNKSTNCGFWTSDYGEEGVCLCIIASGVTLDCQGFGFNNNNRGLAINPWGLNNSIKNCKVSSYTAAVNAIGSQINIDNNEFNNERFWAISIRSHNPQIPNSKFIIANNRISGSNVVDTGIELGSDTINVTLSNADIINNKIENTYLGIYSFSAKNINISNNVVTNNSYGGLFLVSSNSSQINANQIKNIPGFGIFLHNDNSVQVENNQISKSDSGVALISTYNSIVSANKLLSNYLGIILSQGSKWNKISQNTVANGTVGIRIGDDTGDVSDNTIESNNVTTNTERGILVYQTSYRTTLNNNAVCGNKKYDIECRTASYSGDSNVADKVQNCPNLTNTKYCYSINCGRGVTCDAATQQCCYDIQGSPYCYGVGKFCPS